MWVFSTAMKTMNEIIVFLLQVMLLIQVFNVQKLPLKDFEIL